MSKKEKKVKKVQLTLDNMKAGMTMKDLHGKDVQVDNDLIEQMRRYEQESNKSAIWKNKITGNFLYFKYYEDNPQEKKSKKKPKAKEEIEDEELEELEEALEAIELDEEEEEEEDTDEESLMLDAMADYKTEYNIKGKIKTNTKKFRAFFEEWNK